MHFTSTKNYYKSDFTAMSWSHQIRQSYQCLRIMNNFGCCQLGKNQQKQAECLIDFLYVDNMYCKIQNVQEHIDGLMQERHNLSALTMELLLSCINLLMYLYETHFRLCSATPIHLNVVIYKQHYVSKCFLTLQLTRWLSLKWLLFSYYTCFLKIFYFQFVINFLNFHAMDSTSNLIHWFWHQCVWHKN